MVRRIALEDTVQVKAPGRVVLGLFGWIAVCFSAAAFGGLFMPGAWYAQLQKPSWTPPNWIFGPVWTALYIIMAIAVWLVWKSGGFARQKRPLAFFLTQLVFNALWSLCFFGLHNPALGFLDISLLWLALLATVIMFFKARPVAGVLLVPYLAWVTFAAALNLAVWRLNPA